MYISSSRWSLPSTHVSRVMTAATVEKLAVFLSLRAATPSSSSQSVALLQSVLFWHHVFFCSRLRTKACGMRFQNHSVVSTADLSGCSCNDEVKELEGACIDQLSLYSRSGGSTADMLQWCMPICCYRTTTCLTVHKGGTSGLVHSCIGSDSLED